MANFFDSITFTFFAVAAIFFFFGFFCRRFFFEFDSREG